MKIHRKDNTFEIEYNGLPYHVALDYEPEQGLYAKRQSVGLINIAAAGYAEHSAYVRPLQK